MLDFLKKYWWAFLIVIVILWWFMGRKRAPMVSTSGAGPAPDSQTIPPTPAA